MNRPDGTDVVVVDSANECFENELGPMEPNSTRSRGSLEAASQLRSPGSKPLTSTAIAAGESVPPPTTAGVSRMPPASSNGRAAPSASRSVFRDSHGMAFASLSREEEEALAEVDSYAKETHLRELRGGLLVTLGGEVGGARDSPLIQRAGAVPPPPMPLPEMAPLPPPFQPASIAPPASLPHRLSEEEEESIARMEQLVSAAPILPRMAPLPPPTPRQGQRGARPGNAPAKPNFGEL